MEPAIITAGTTVVVALLAFLFNQYSQLRLERRQGRLARVNNQLRDLYGPLSVLVHTNEWIWRALRANGLPPAAERTAKTLSRDWAAWHDNILMPTNIRIRDLIVEHADLILEVDFPGPLRDFCAHVGSCEAIFAESAAGGGASGGARTPVHIGHPGSEFVNYVHRSVLRLKGEQQRLLASRSREDNSPLLKAFKSRINP
jgi:hypothetical protein